jgi:aryl-phospho-beta-D-glucosidase BglC (GH1 family)
VKQVVQYCVDNGLYVIVNIHWDGGWLDNNINSRSQAAVNAKQKAYWEQIATTLRDLIFASANEPPVNDATQMAILLSYHQTFVNAVRSTGGRNAYRTLVVQGPSTDIDKTFTLMNSMPTDTVMRRMMAEVHYYTPYQFTLMDADQSWGNQFYYWGAGYHSSTDTAHNATWGEEADLDALYAKMKTKFVNQGIPVVIGEFAAMKRSTTLSGADLQLHLNSRAHFHNYASRQAVANGMMPFYWDNGVNANNGFALFNRQTNTVVDQQTIDALVRGGNGLGL